MNKYVIKDIHVSKLQHFLDVKLLSYLNNSILFVLEDRMPTFIKLKTAIEQEYIQLKGHGNGILSISKDLYMISATDWYDIYDLLYYNVDVPKNWVEQYQAGQSFFDNQVLCRTNDGLFYYGYFNRDGEFIKCKLKI